MIDFFLFLSVTFSNELKLMMEERESGASGGRTESGRPGRQLKKSEMQKGSKEIRKPHGGGGPKSGQWSFPSFQPPET
jgi:hypothetical protein